MTNHLKFVTSFYENLKRDYEGIHSVLDLTEWEESWAILHTIVEMDWTLLPVLGKAFEQALITGCLFSPPTVFGKHEGTELPFVFYEFFSAIFDNAGYRIEPISDLHAAKQADYVWLIRQIFLAFSKLSDVEPTVIVEDEISCYAERLTTKHYPYSVMDKESIKVARLILSSVFVDEDGRPSPCFAQWVDNPFGAHGPGAVAGSEHDAQKWNFQDIKGTDPNLYYLDQIPLYDRLMWGDSATNTADPIARLCVVPKDFSKHRMICIEPKELMFAQQGLMRCIYDRVHQFHPTRRSINFFDQEESRLACKVKGFSTLDLSDASDRLTLTLMRNLVPKSVFSLLTRYRSRGISLPDDSVIANLETMYTMGNALCFPIETLVFWSLALATMLLEDTHNSVASASERYKQMVEDCNHPSWDAYKMQVFGDDIVIPSRYYSSLVHVLTCAGFSINRSKSCHHTPVREACGAWWYGQIDCTIVRFRKSQPSDVRVWQAWADNARDLHARGLTQSAMYVLSHAQIIFPVPYGYLGLPGQRNPVALSQAGLYRWNNQFQREEVRVPDTVEVDCIRSLPGSAGFYAWLVGGFTHAVTHGAVVKPQWVWAG